LEGKDHRESRKTTNTARIEEVLLGKKKEKTALEKTVNCRFRCTAVSFVIIEGSEKRKEGKKNKKGNFCPWGLSMRRKRAVK